MKNNTHHSPPLILAIDTSCDETSAAVVQGRVVLSNIIASQTLIHQPYGGVFPTLAKQAHRENIAPTVKKALDQARIDFRLIDAIGVTQGPGLAPALEVGIKYAQKLALAHHKPLYGINHLEAHLLSILAQRNSKKHSIIKKNSSQVTNRFPVLGIIVSGGHSQFVRINQIGKYQVLGETVDDALGEALDKVGRMLDLGYPAGAVIEKLAKHGNKGRYDFPLPMTSVKDFNLSYSGLKTAASRMIKEKNEQNKVDSLSKQDIFDFCASFQQAAFRHLCYKLNKLLQDEASSNLSPNYTEVWLGGGVASNIALRKEIRKVLRQHRLRLITPYEKRLCSDNAAMIGITIGLRIMHNQAQPNKKLDRQPSWNL